ncbi:hypothetical protein TUN199_01299 [Pyrenophora tritici-repentis]|uniref:Uncharacterized protein n=1 Tax=Pyrenophora tritici-repentis TaxID=45151 RepID=A0A2W1EDX0_9PLEO|nr:hypothetical protein PtrV1_13843 [Pyrenophora tritici-repentis]KAF7569466.1 hypothetical protein PtrM4_118810 [Pyrenophora tritici-repentis]KAI0626745.1 hypothetical protein TUN199_01299 [Pyrenophora tritici-repentis]KAI1510404.1 hypothetical protein Ptr86124_010850 [Pyrenophora tritici-repentis]KAI1569427.1 hypothetical protein PtrEW4_005893 [Pyrenophora tritici-repentis]
MHNALTALASVFFLVSSTNALYFPRFRLSSTKALHHDLTNKCTFTLWHKQLCTASRKTNYIQIFEIEDHANNLTINIAELQPAVSRNSYTKISASDVFAIKGLLDDKSLAIGASQFNDDEVLFQNDEILFSSASKNSEEAWCVTGEWDIESWGCGEGSRQRKMECAFPCRVIGEEDNCFGGNCIEPGSMIAQPTLRLAVQFVRMPGD